MYFLSLIGVRSETKRLFFSSVGFVFRTILCLRLGVLADSVPDTKCSVIERFNTKFPFSDFNVVAVIQRFPTCGTPCAYCALVVREGLPGGTRALPFFYKNLDFHSFLVCVSGFVSN